MTPVDDYIATLTPENQVEFKRIGAIIKQEIPDITQGISYGMPTYLYKGKGLISTMVTKKFLSLYPFSGKVGGKLEEKLKEFETTPGSIHFSLEKPLSDELLKDIIAARKLEIDQKESKS